MDFSLTPAVLILDNEAEERRLLDLFATVLKVVSMVSECNTMADLLRRLESPNSSWVDPQRAAEHLERPDLVVRAGSLRSIGEARSFFRDLSKAFLGLLLPIFGQQFLQIFFEIWKEDKAWVRPESRILVQVLYSMWQQDKSWSHGVPTLQSLRQMFGAR